MATRIEKFVAPDGVETYRVLDTQTGREIGLTHSLTKAEDMQKTYDRISISHKRGDFIIQQEASRWAVRNTSGGLVKVLPTLVEADDYVDKLNTVAAETYKSDTFSVINRNNEYHVKNDRSGKTLKPFKTMVEANSFLNQVREIIKARSIDAIIEPSIDYAQQPISGTFEAALDPNATGKDEARRKKLAESLSIQELMPALFRQIASKAGSLGFGHPSETVTNDVCDYIFYNYMENNRRVKILPDDNKIENLISYLQQYSGIDNARVTYDDHPNKMTVSLVVKPHLRFQTDEEEADWSERLHDLIASKKPSGLRDLEIVFIKSEVF